MRTLFVTALVFAAGTAQAQQPVTWTAQQNAIVRGSSLEKSGGCQGCDDSGAFSQQMIRSGDGYVEFTVGEDWTFWMAGLTRRDGTARFGNIDFAIRFNGNGMADVVENGRYVGGDINYIARDQFRVEIQNGRVRYIKNGGVMYTSNRQPAYPLVFEASLGSRGSSVRNAQMAARDSAVATSGSFSGAESQFSALDRNGDDVISRGEWRGSRYEFDQLDRNRDNFISRDEYGIADNNGYNDGRRGYGRSRQLGRVGTSGQQVTVDASRPWFDTGIYVRAGDSINFDATGRIQMSDNGNDVATPGGSNRTAPNAPLQNGSAGMLIGRIDNSPVFAIGNNRRITAQDSGRLFLGVNDDYFGDNSGNYRVTVTVEPR